MTPTTSTGPSVTYGHDAAMARFSVTRYQRMIETGILTPDDPVASTDFPPRDVVTYLN